MVQYKAVPTSPVIDFTDYDEDLPLQLKEYADRITKESEGGWEFVGLYPFQARHVEKGGLIGKMIKNKIAGRDIFDSVKQSFSTNMMLFRKTDASSLSAGSNESANNTVVQESINISPTVVSTGEIKSLDQIAKNRIRITRLKSVVGSAMLVNIKVDNQSFQLENGEEKIIDLENGEYTISASFNDDHEKLDFKIDNDQKQFEVCIKPPLTMTMK